jgi:PIN domain nuclease of toxin-antitoxin system
MVPVTADTATSVPDSFPPDPADRLIYATAIEPGWRPVTKDPALRAHTYPRPVTLW